MVVVLRQHGIDASKARDEKDPERWTVRVPSSVQVEAVHALESRGLPRPPVNGFEAYYPGEGLVPTASEEHVLLQYATAQELRRGLLSIDGVIDAHVNLVLPDTRTRRARSKDATDRARASVVLKFDATADAPVTDVEVRQFVAGGVDHLALEDVTVLMTPARASLRPLEDPQIVQVGPISVSAGAKTVTQIVFVVLIAMILALAGALAATILRRRR